MSINDRYVFVDEPPETGVNVASATVIENYKDILDKIADNNQNSENGAYYNEADKPPREVSYVFALNSIYRELLKWQNRLPDHDEVKQMRQEIRDIFPYFMKNEFPQPENAPLPNFEIKDDCIDIDTQDPKTGEIIDPQLFEIDAENKKCLLNLLDNVRKFANYAAHNQQFDTLDDQSIAKLRKNNQTSFSVMHKMSAFLQEKSQNRRVYDVRTAEEKVRTIRNTLRKQLENITKVEAVNSGSFGANRQRLGNTLDSLGMEMVWCKEPPYESEFVDNLYYMQQDLKESIANKTQLDSGFYEGKLPVFLDLCQNLHKHNPQETKNLMQKLTDFLKSSHSTKEALLDVVTEARNVSMNLRKIDHAKSCAMRSAWDGLIKMPKETALSFEMKKLLDLKNLEVTGKSEKSYSAEEISAYKNADFNDEDYKLGNSQIWNICKQVPQLATFENKIAHQLKLMKFNPEKINNLNFEDIAYLINKSEVEHAQFRDGVQQGVMVASDKSQFYKNLVKDNEKELRKTLSDYYTNKYTIEATSRKMTAVITDEKEKAEIAKQAQNKADKVINDFKRGIGCPDFNAHHTIPLSCIAYFEQVTGKPFTEINKEILLVNKEVHDLLHITENAMDNSGQMRVGRNISCRTKYINKNKLLLNGKRVAGYIGQAVFGIVLPKKGIIAMPDIRSFVFDKKQLESNIEQQELLLGYRQAVDADVVGKVKEEVLQKLSQAPLKLSSDSVNLQKLVQQLRDSKSTPDYFKFATQFKEFKDKIIKFTTEHNCQLSPLQQVVAKTETSVFMPNLTIPHASVEKVTEFLQKGIKTFADKAKEIGFAPRTANKATNIEMGKARDKVKTANVGKSSNYVHPHKLNKELRVANLPKYRR